MSTNTIKQTTRKLDNGYTFDILGGHIVKEFDQATTHPPILFRDYREASPQLQLSLTNICNFSCEYCSFRKRAIEAGAPAYMPKDLAKRATTIFYNNYNNCTKYARIDYGLSGEPLLKSSMHHELNEHIKSVFKDTSIQEIQVGTRTTNGTLLNKPGWEKMIGYPMDISCDGPKEINDGVRKYNNGTGTYDDVRIVIDKALKHDPRLSVSTVLTAAHTNILDIYLHLKDELGFKAIYMKPVNLKHTSEKSLNENSLEDFKQGYTELVNYILDQPPAKMLECLLSFDSQDFFMRYVYRVLHRSVQVYRCGAGISGSYVDTDGKLYPCAHFIGKTDYAIGTIDEGVNPAAHKKHLNLRVDKIKGCSTCWVRYLCGGGCHYQAVLANDKIDEPDQVKCKLVRHLCSEAIRMICAIKERAPSVLTALPAPYLIPSKDIDIDPDHTYRPTSQLSATNQKFDINLSGTNALERGVIDHPFHMQASMKLEEDMLSVFIDTDLHIKSIEFNVIKQQDLRDFLYSDLLEQGDLPSKLQFIASREKSKIEQVKEKRDGPMRIIPYHKPKISVVENSSCTFTDNHCEAHLPIDPSFSLANGKQEIGFDMCIGLDDGAYIQLVRYEPFCILDLTTTSWLKPSGGEFDLDIVYDQDINKLNASPLKNYDPITRMTRIKANVC